MIETSGTPGMNDVINASLREIARLAGENSAIGTPIETTAGITVIPVCRVSVGFASGGIGTDGHRAEKKNFGGGGGTGISVTPIAFLTVSKERGAELIPVAPSAGAQSVDRIAALIENAPDLLRRLKGAFFSR